VGDNALVTHTDLNVITAEINAYKQVVSDSLLEIGERLAKVHDNPEKYGLNGYADWESWCLEKLEMTRSTANKFIQAHKQFGATSRRISVSKIFEMISLPADIDRQEFVEQSHKIPTTGETKTIDEMTTLELRAVKKALREAEAQRELALRDAQILRDTLESIEDKEPEVEIRTEYVEVSDESSEEKLRKYEEMFGDISIYEQGSRRVSNRTEVMSSIQMFSHDTRSLLKKYAYFEQYSREIREMPAGVREEFKSTLEAINNFVVDMAEAVGINSGNIIDAEIIEN